ncbi:MAG: UvrD-helicase domain-containing protein [Candidatus Woesearchaeota archaeon]
MSLNQEKLEIINIEGNVLVTANPGTGKTRLLAYKYLDLIKKGIMPEKILCLTFTEKAKKEMESRILNVIKQEKISFDFSKLNVFTFHSYALNNLDEKEIISTNLLRYTIFKYLKENEVLKYEDNYLLENIVPKIEGLLRYLKSFGILPDMINIEEVKINLDEDNKYTKEEIDKFAEHFVNIFKHYESIKNKRGLDYADMLIRFLQLRKIPIYDYVLVDELQDVNTMEAEIALKSCKNFFAVGDKKQAIFGFQGGSILNFKKFENSTKKVLSENFRSSQEILDYAKEYFITKTKELSHKEELKDLKNADNKKSKKPIIYEVDNNSVYSIACELAKNFIGKGKTAIITRTNYQIENIEKELKARNIEHSSTFYGSSNEAKKHIINFLKGLFSSDIKEIKNSFFTIFFPCSLQMAFELVQEKYDSLEKIYQKLPEYKRLRESIKTVEDVNSLFIEKIFPVCISYGKEYLTSAMTLKQSFQESLDVLENKDIYNIINYLYSADLGSQESDVEKSLVVTTVHKAKGKEFDNVIYIPSEVKDKSNFVDNVVESILLSKGMNVKEELEEESLRINFVAFTRAMENLVILTSKVQDFINDYAELKQIEIEINEVLDLDESKKKAYSLFVNKEYDKAKELLESKKSWIKDFIKEHFASLDHTSFSSMPESAYKYFINKIIAIRETSFSMTLGSEVHDAAEIKLKGQEPIISEKAFPYLENVNKIIEEIKKNYNFKDAEYEINCTLRDLGFDSDLKFLGYIDAIFKNENEYLILDWKTDKDTGNDSKHRQQLEVYKRAYSFKEKIPLEKIKVAIGFVGLRGTINTGKIDYKLDMKQPDKSAFETFSNRVNLLLSWINNTDKFFEDFINEKVDDAMWRSVVEEYLKEIN